LPANSSAESLGGEYQLRLVATSGEKSGSAVNGRLTLQPQSRSLLYRSRLGGGTDSAVAHPLFGAADIDLSAVDAVLVGNTESLDPLQPGVLVIERHARPGRPPLAEIVLRLGSEANRMDRQRVEGGYTALWITELTPTGFAGTWRSGIMSQRSAGYFCAVRKDGKDGKDG
jgi:hypothetical protein